jgi:heme A synthase
MQLVFRLVTVATVLAAISQVTLGGVVRVTDSGLGCPDWPLCHGSIIPPFNLTTLIEYSHRLSASALMLLVLSVAALTWTFYRPDPRMVVSSLLGVALVLAAAALGGVTVLTELAWWGVLLHLGIAEAALACMVIVAFLGWRGPDPVEEQRKAGAKADRFNLMVLGALLGTFALILSGSYMVGYGAGSSCGTWPLCRGSLLPDGTPYAIHMGHRFLAGFVGLLILATALSAWSRRATSPELGWVSLLLVSLFAAQVAAGAAMVWAGFSSTMKATHLTLATLVWASLVMLGAAVYSRQQLDLSNLPSISRRTLPLGRSAP